MARQLWFNGTLTAATGTVREFNSPPLSAGKHIYDVQARWIENGQDMTEAQKVEVTPGSHVEVDFPAQPKTAEKKREPSFLTLASRASIGCSPQR